MIKKWTLSYRILFVALCGAFICCNDNSHPEYQTWGTYRGDNHSTGYSELDQINSKNVNQLKVAWTYQSGFETKSGSQCNPIVVDGVMYIVTPGVKVVALNPITGEPYWSFDPLDGKLSEDVVRAVTYWKEGEDARILFTAGFRLFAVDAKTGKPIKTFGQDGSIDMRNGLGRDPESVSIKTSSPGIIFKDKLILGGSVGFTTPGDIRAFNVRTGEIEWSFHSLPRPGEFGYDTWDQDAWKKAGGANNWGGMSLDNEREMVIFGTGTGTPDFYAGEMRGAGENLFGNCIMALDANTGERIWHFQTIRHDLWDYDIPAPPVLVRVQHENNMIDAVAQVTKQGFTFVLDRETGESLFPIEEKEFPQSEVEGEDTWPTQPIPVLPEPFTRQYLTEADLTNISPEAHKYALDRFNSMNYKGFYTPPSTIETLRYPSTQGGANWGGASYDPETNLLYVNTNEYGNTIRLQPIKTAAKGTEDVKTGAELFSVNCSTCHSRSGAEFKSEFPVLDDVQKKFTKEQIVEIVVEGRGRMPAFTTLTTEERDKLVNFLYGEEKELSSDSQSQEKKEIKSYKTEFAYNHFVDEEGYFATKPPWGTLNAINLNTGKIEWKVPLGEYEALTKRGIPITGTKNYGGSIVTAGGLVFIAGTSDSKIRAFDKETGAVLWEHALPAPGGASPSTYTVNGKQYIVIAATGGRVQEAAVPYKTSDAFIAFALPDKTE